MLPIVFYAQALITLVHGQADRARRNGFNERGASALEWAIISGIVVSLAAIIAVVIRNVVLERTDEIQQEF